LAQARALRAAFPDPAAMAQVAVGDGWPKPPGGDGLSGVWAALRYLRDEMVLVRDGRAGTLAVLDDEIAHVEHQLARV
jgi:hypothetical protein